MSSAGFVIGFVQLCSSSWFPYELEELNSLLIRGGLRGTFPKAAYLLRTMSLWCQSTRRV